MKILYLGDIKNEFFFSFFTRNEICIISNKEFKFKEFKEFDWIISYGYRYIISHHYLKNLKNPIINLHISYLPFADELIQIIGASRITRQKELKYILLMEGLILDRF